MAALLSAGCASSHGTASADAQRARACVVFSAAMTNTDPPTRATLLNEAHAAALASGDRGLAGGMDPAAVSRARTAGQYASFVKATTDRCHAITWKPSVACTLRRVPCPSIQSGSGPPPTTAG